MHIITVGLNYKSAPVHVREKFAVAEQEISKALIKLKHTTSILECVIVATCNRTEIYAVVDRQQVCGHYIRNFMQEWFGVPIQEFNDHLYIYQDEQAIRHLYRVACGLDSMIIGETQILGQIRDAFLQAQSQKTTGTLFNQLFKQVVTLAKRAHSETGIGEHAVSVSYAAVELGKRIFGSFEDKHVMILGAGKMSELTAKHLHANGASQITVVNRSFDRAQELAHKFQGNACPYEQMLNQMHDVDILISSTGATQYVITRTDMEPILQKRKSRPLFMIDIAVPRDLDPALNEASNVFLYDIDDLEGIVESNLALRQQECAKIEQMIETDIQTYDEWYKTLEVVPLIRALQEKSVAVHEEVMENLWRKLPDLDDHERKVIRKLTKSIVNQFMHDPILHIKDLALKRSGHEAIDMFAKIFALEEHLARHEAKNVARTEQASFRERGETVRKKATMSPAAGSLAVRS